MPRRSDKRERLIAAARQLFHQQGLGETTLADIAEVGGVPLGNVYYYFRTKEDLAAAVVEERTREYARLFEAWEREHPDPRARLQAYLSLLVENRETLARAGCPVGGLCQELDKLRSPLARRANGILEAHLEWVTDQFRGLGAGARAPALGLHLLTVVQGMSLLAQAFGDPEVVTREARTLRRWLDQI